MYDSKVLTAIGNSNIQLCKINVILLVNKNYSVPNKQRATLINSKDFFYKAASLFGVGAFLANSIICL